MAESELKRLVDLVGSEPKRLPDFTGAGPKRPPPPLLIPEL